MKAIEVHLDQHTFDSTTAQILRFPGQHDIDLFPVPKPIHVPFDADKSKTADLTVDLLGLDGALLGSTTISIQPKKELQRAAIEIPGRGSAELSFKLVKMYALDNLEENACGLSISCTLIGREARNDTPFKDVRVRVREAGGAQQRVLGSRKLNNKTHGAFIELDESKGAIPANLELVVSFQVYGAEDEMEMVLPLQARSPMVATIPFKSPGLALLLTYQLVQHVNFPSVVHDATLHLGDAANRSLLSGGGPFAFLNKTNLAHCRILSPSASDADAALQATVLQESFVTGVFGYPPRAAVGEADDGVLVACKVDSERSRGAKKLLHNNLGVLVAPTGAIDGSPIRVIVSLIDLDCPDHSGFAISPESTAGKASAIPQLQPVAMRVARGILTEKTRDTNPQTGIVTVELEGQMEVADSLPDAAATARQANNAISMNVMLSITPFKHSRDSDANSSETAGPPGTRANGIGEMRGLSELDSAAFSDEEQKRWRRSAMEELDLENGFTSPGAGFGEGMSPKAIVGFKRGVGGGTALAQLIKAELVTKQQTIDRLMDEAAARTDAIQFCGREIRALRDETAELRLKIRELESAVEQRDKASAEAVQFVEDVLKAPERLTHLSRETLVNVAAEMGKKYKKTDEERLELKRIAAEAKSARQQYQEQQKALAELNDAHIQQSQVLQKMQKKMGKVEAYKSTILMQERVISKMQAVIESRLRTARREGGEAAGLLDKLLKDIERQERESASQVESERIETQTAEKLEAAEEELARANATISTLKSKVAQLETALKDKPVESNLEAASANRRIDELEAELTAAGFRISALEGQLDAQAQDSGREIARLRTLLFEFEMAAALGPTDEDLGGDVPGLVLPSGSSAKAASALRSADAGTLEDAARARSSAGVDGDGPDVAASSDVVNVAPQGIIGLGDKTFTVTLEGEGTGPVGVVDLQFFVSVAEENFMFELTSVIVKNLQLPSPREEGSDNPLILVDLSFDAFAYKTDHIPLETAAGSELRWNYNRGSPETSFTTSKEDAMSKSMLAVAFEWKETTANVIIGSGEKILGEDLK